MVYARLVVCYLLLGLRSASGGGFNGDAEHLKMTRKPIPILTGIGSVDFRITCHNAQTQQYFNQGIALLHAYEPRQADRSFYEALRIERECAMTWWGLAMANQDNRPLAAFYAEQAEKLQTSVSDREKLWIGALKAYVDPGTSDVDRRMFLVTSLDRIFTQYPDDLEAAAFLVRQFIQNREAGIPIPLMAAADLMIDHVLRQNPSHPIHHYKLLLWETKHPERALESVNKVRRVFASAARIQTAAGRILSSLERFDDALACFEASTSIALQQIERDRMCPVDLDGFIENTQQQIEHLALVGRVAEAVSLARKLVEMPSPVAPTLASVDVPSVGHLSRATHFRPAPTALSPKTLGQQKLLDILVEFRCWQDLLSLAHQGYFESADQPIQIRRAHVVGLAHFYRRDANAVAAQIEQLRELQTSPLDPRSSLGHSSVSTQIDATIRELQWCEFALRNQSKLSSEPSRRLPSQRLMELFPELGDPATLEAFAADSTTRRLGAAQRLDQATLLSSAGKLEAAMASLKDLKQAFPRIDAKLIQRLDPNYSTPATGSTLPFSPSWQPPPVPQFRLPDQNGSWVSLEEWRGKPLVLVFYLGAGCPHCIEQLKSFAPLREEYARSGLTVIAVSTDSVTGLQQTLQVAGAGDAIPFLLVSDEAQLAFRSFGVYDTRDNEPLHGTFLVNPQGRIAWYRISREPFMATVSLLTEARRILSLGQAPSRDAAAVSVE